MANLFKIVLGIALVIFLIAIGPLAIIWSVMEWREVLVNGADPWNIWVWLATVVLAAALRANVTVKR